MTLKWLEVYCIALATREDYLDWILKLTPKPQISKDLGLTSLTIRFSLIDSGQLSL